MSDDREGTRAKGERRGRGSDARLDDWALSARRAGIASRWGAVLAGPLLVASAHRSAAAEGSEPPRLAIDYVAAQGCPALDWFRQRISVRTARVVFATEPVQADISTARVRFDEDGRQGHLRLDEGSASGGPRIVVGRDCFEVADGMALIIAMALDPTVTPEAAESPPELDEEASENELPDDASAPVPVDVAAPPSGIDPEPQRPPLEVRSLAKEEPAESRGLPALSQWGVAFGVGGAVGTGWGAGTSLGLLGWASVERRLSAPFSLMAWFSLEVDRTKELPTTGGTGEFKRSLGRLGGCPLRWGPTDRWVLRPCAQFELGQVVGAGEGIPAARSARAPWYGVALALRSEISPLENLIVALDGSMSVPLTHDRFVLAPDTEIVRYPWVALGGALTVAVAFGPQG